MIKDPNVKKAKLKKIDAYVEDIYDLKIEEFNKLIKNWHVRLIKVSQKTKRKNIKQKLYPFDYIKAKNKHRREY